MATKKETKAEKRGIAYFLAYLFEWLSGLIVYLTAGMNENLKKHAMQAILLGVASIILALIFTLLLLPLISSILNTFIWLYGLYVGYQAYNGSNVSIPIISNYVWKMGKSEAKTETTTSKVKTTKEIKYEEESLKALKLRYAKGKITKKEYNKIKKELQA